ncbi:MAG TPA: Uma2 family endonuclease [Planctomycetales bacterium]|jgi:Uma2 family endonuclease|nr:Uma2 family endonuclease [Planctomycetales bacterium]
MATTKPGAGSWSNGRPPPLENGDRLTRIEFERRYEAMPRVKKAELIEGVVHMPSPVRIERHSRPNSRLNGWLLFYEAGTIGVATGCDATTRLDTDNEPQPDGVLYIEPAFGGQVRISADDYIEGAPELAVEVAASNVSIALNAKMNVYRRTGVREYIVWRVLDQEIDWFVLRDGRYDRLRPDAEGVYRSEIFPGLWLDTAALLRGDIAGMLATVQRGIASPEHGAFVDRLNAASGGPPLTNE